MLNNLDAALWFQSINTKNGLEVNGDSDGDALSKNN